VNKDVYKDDHNWPGRAASSGNAALIAAGFCSFAVCTGSTYNPSIMGREGLCATLSTVCTDIPTREQNARLLCRFLNFSFALLHASYNRFRHSYIFVLIINYGFERIVI